MAAGAVVLASYVALNNLTPAGQARNSQLAKDADYLYQSAQANIQADLQSNQQSAAVGATITAGVIQKAAQSANSALDQLVNPMSPGKGYSGPPNAPYPDNIASGIQMPSPGGGNGWSPLEPEIVKSLLAGGSKIAKVLAYAFGITVVAAVLTGSGNPQDDQGVIPAIPNPSPLPTSNGPNSLIR